MPKIIDADEFYKALDKRGRMYMPEDGLMYFAEWKVFETLEKQPALNVVELVRCKNCTHCDPENLHCDHPMGTTLPVPRKPDDFCSYGERRTDG